jgi:hypothetical protein
MYTHVGRNRRSEKTYAVMKNLPLYRMRNGFDRELNLVTGTGTSDWDDGRSILIIHATLDSRPWAQAAQTRPIYPKTNNRESCTSVTYRWTTFLQNFVDASETATIVSDSAEYSVVYAHPRRIHGQLVCCTLACIGQSHNEILCGDILWTKI